ncbi:MAG: hypothetical protein LUQ65_02135 [Candidatus Helarchaeota archaeon]|nr:hypothetical protein [Candidatus Helarchaeota archaeon]
MEEAKIAKLTESIEKLETDCRAFKEDLTAKKLDREEFEGKKLNFLEEVKKISYEIKQLKELVSTKNQTDQVVIRELNSLSEQFQTEVDEDTGIATVFVEASLDTHFEIDIDCSRYPDPPYLFIPKMMDDFLGSEFVLTLKTLKNWSRKKPPHLVNIFKELEEKLVAFFQEKEETIDDRGKMAKRRKLIELARNAEQAENIAEAIDLYRGVLELSKELKDKATYIKFEQRIEELEKEWQKRVKS